MTDKTMFLLCEDGLLRQAATVPVVVNFGTVSLSVSLALMCRNKISYLLSYRFSLILWPALAAVRWSEPEQPPPTVVLGPRSPERYRAKGNGMDGESVQQCH